MTLPTLENDSVIVKASAVLKDQLGVFAKKNFKRGEAIFPVNTTLSPSERRVPAKAVEHVEEPPVVEHVEQAHDLADPATHDGQRGPGPSVARARSICRKVNATAVSTT